MNASELTPEEAWRLVDESAQRNLHMSAAEFIFRWDAGEWAGKTENRKVMRVAMLLPLVTKRAADWSYDK